MFLGLDIMMLSSLQQFRKVHDSTSSTNIPFKNYKILGMACLMASNLSVLSVLSTE